MLKRLAEEWKCIGIIVATAVALCGTAVGFDQRYAKSVNLKQLQLSANYNNFQTRLAALTKLCKTTACDADTIRTIKWLERQIRMIEAEMGM